MFAPLHLSLCTSHRVSFSREFHVWFLQFAALRQEHATLLEQHRQAERRSALFVSPEDDAVVQATQHRLQAVLEKRRAIAGQRPVFRFTTENVSRPVCIGMVIFSGSGLCLQFSLVGFSDPKILLEDIPR